MKMALKDQMTRQLITICRTASTTEAHRLMMNYWIRHLPVTDEAEEFIIGILSERDILSAPSGETQVEEIMSTPIKTFDVNASVQEIVAAMIEDKVSAYLLTENGNEGKIVGIITSEDLLILLNKLLRKESASGWDLSEILANPELQRAAYIIGQAGV